MFNSIIRRAIPNFDYDQKFNSDFDFLPNLFSEFMLNRDFPPVNVLRSENNLIFTMELPGINPDELEITAKNDTLSIKGSRKFAELPEGCEYRRQERGQGSFARDFGLPFNVEPDSIEAVYKNGILTVKAEKAKSERPRKISVKTQD